MNSPEALSQHTISRLRLHETQQHVYRPRPEYMTELHDVSLVLMPGPSAAGKSTLMETAAAMDTEFGLTGTFTNREPRVSDAAKPYTYIKNTDEALGHTLDRIEQGKVVQYAIFPGTQDIYGTEVADYGHRYSMLDAQYGSVQAFAELPVRSLSNIGVVLAPDFWLEQFNERWQPGNVRRLPRAREGERCWEWTAAQPDDKLHLVENIPYKPEIAARKIIAIARGQAVGNPELRPLLQSCISAAKSIQ